MKGITRMAPLGIALGLSGCAPVRSGADAGKAFPWLYVLLGMALAGLLILWLEGKGGVRIGPKGKKRDTEQGNR